MHLVLHIRLISKNVFFTSDSEHLEIKDLSHQRTQICKAGYSPELSRITREEQLSGSSCQRGFLSTQHYWYWKEVVGVRVGRTNIHEMERKSNLSCQSCSLPGWDFRSDAVLFPHTRSFSSWKTSLYILSWSYC